MQVALKLPYMRTSHLLANLKPLQVTSHLKRQMTNRHLISCPCCISTLPCQSRPLQPVKTSCLLHLAMLALLP